APPRRAAPPQEKAAPSAVAHAKLTTQYEKLVGLALIVLFAAIAHSQLIPLIADSDSFYHIRHAWEYRIRGIGDSSFPWAQYSAVRTCGADIWYGFHLLMIPVTLLHPLLNGIYGGAFAVTVASLWLLFLAFRRLHV